MAHVARAKGEPLRPASETTEPVAVDARVQNLDVVAAVDHDRGVAPRSGIDLGIAALQGRAGEIDGDAVAPNRDRPAREAIGPTLHADRVRDHEPRCQLDW